ncbi:hypothetical protein Taro_044297 [Colocasia esculenta]|uniref:Uncharacterized protein n=1 Tax=Colocasia esculenta TaxID=4460 RepID=A0A843X5A7_COLES|nr:hypothetical protein [Colocasia esculenta]
MPKKSGYFARKAPSAAVQQPEVAGVNLVRLHKELAPRGRSPSSITPQKREGDWECCSISYAERDRLKVVAQTPPDNRNNQNPMAPSNVYLWLWCSMVPPGSRPPQPMFAISDLGFVLGGSKKRDLGEILYITKGTT